MKAIATGEFRLALPPPPARGAMAAVRRIAADFWLNWLFFWAEHSPLKTRITKNFYLWFANRYSHQIRRSTTANARRILGAHLTDEECADFGRRVVSNFYDFVYDVGRSMHMSREELLDQIESIEGSEKYDAARAPRKGAIVVTAHMGSFEVGMASLRQREERIHVVFKRDIRSFERIRQTMRQRLGIMESPVDEAGWSIWVRLRDALRNDEVVVFQGDRVMPGQKGQPVPFLGGHLLLPTGPIKLAIAAGGSPIIPILTVRSPAGKVKLFVEDAIWVREDDRPVGGVHPALRQMATVLEKYVRTYPDQWFVLQEAFVEDAPHESAEERA